jgi:nucleoside-diphosphate-sugar epimerase
MNILIIGGTRNLGHYLTYALLGAGHRVTVINRGLTTDELPQEVERLRADRTDADQLKAALGGREFDAVVDTALYKGPEAEAVVNLLRDKTGHYVFLSTGQVYLVRKDLARPFSEADYDGPLMTMPEPNTYNYEEWSYGYDKRKAEDVLTAAWEQRKFPFTTLRLPMVNSERDHFKRLYSYMLRLKDGGPILVPTTPDYRLRHVYGKDVVKAMMKVLETGAGKGQAFNISQDETVTFDEFLAILGDIMGIEPQVVRVERDLLEANGFLPDCSPFSDLWMSELSNDLSKAVLDFSYTPLADYVRTIVSYYETNRSQIPPPAGYRRRQTERSFGLRQLER